MNATNTAGGPALTVDIRALNKVWDDLKRSEALDLYKQTRSPFYLTPMRFMGLDVIVDTPQPKMQLSPHVQVSDEFRAKMNAWMLEFFGWHDNIVKPNTCLRFGNFLMIHPVDQPTLLAMTAV